ncbi:hypothetical protein P4829_13670 [Bacillus atrophaeus]|nr:hypothetical protein [Bacillus atrophaeus]WFE12966.1 hypothetical protein P4829_13670 [Bacillus atrophaeus]
MTMLKRWEPMQDARHIYAVDHDTFSLWKSTCPSLTDAYCTF